MLMKNLGFRAPRPAEEARILAAHARGEFTHHFRPTVTDPWPDVLVPAAVLNAEPLISYSGLLREAPLGLANFGAERLRGHPAWFMISPTWSIEAEDVAQGIREAAILHRARIPHHRLIFVCNTPEEVLLLQKFGEAAYFYNKTANSSERIFRPLERAAVDFDAIYNAQLRPWKRHELTLEIESCAFLTYRDSLLLDAAPSEAAIMARHAATPPGHVFLNAFDEVGMPIRLPLSEVNRHLNRAGVGLCLSEREGAMFASTEYLLSGLPVVSTPSTGGRHVYYDAEYCWTVPPDPRSVAEAVAALKAKGIPRSYIHKRILERLGRDRARFLELINAILEESGSDKRLAMPWPFRKPVTMEWLPSDEAIDRAAHGIVDGFERKEKQHKEREHERLCNATAPVEGVSDRRRRRAKSGCFSLRAVIGWEGPLPNIWRGHALDRLAPTIVNDELLVLLGRVLAINATSQLTSELRSRFFRPNFSWQALVDLAVAHEILPPLIFALKERFLLPPVPTTLGPQAHTAHVTSRLEVAYVEHLERQADLRSQLTTALGALNGEGIVPALLKGAVHLTALQSKRHQARGMRDLDILVRASEANKADRILSALGYRPDHDPPSLGRHLPELRLPGRAGTIEIHTEALSFNARHALSTDEVWSRTETRSFAGTTFRALSPEWHLVHGLLHHQLANHGYARRMLALKGLWEFASVGGEISPPRWRVVIAHAEQRRILAMLSSWCIQAHRLFGLDAPQELLTSETGRNHADATFRNARRSQGMRQALFLADKLRFAFAPKTLALR